MICFYLFASVISEQYNGEDTLVIEDGVTEINESQYENCSNYTKIIFPTSLRVIGNLAFAHCEGLIHLNFPPNLERIGKQSFIGCLNLTTVTFSNALKIINSYAFCNCSSLSTLSLPSSLESLERSSFQDCTQLTEVAFNASDTNISAAAFSGCLSLTNVTLPKSTKIIRESQFENCRNLTKLVNTGNIEIIEDKAFTNCSKFWDFTFENLIEIGSFSFQNSNIGVAMFGRELKSIGEYSFSNCQNLSYAEFYLIDTKLSEGTFSHCASLHKLSMSIKQSKIPDYFADGCENLKNAYLGDELKEVCDCAFRECYNLQKVSFYQYLTKIGESAFESCTGLTSVTFEQCTLTEIGPISFYGCSNLNSVVLPKPIASINIGAFALCTDLSHVTLPDTLKVINASAFEECIALSDINWPASLEYIGEMAFLLCFDLKELFLPKTIEYIGERAFFATPNLKKITTALKSDFIICDTVFNDLLMLNELDFLSNNFDILKFTNKSNITKIVFNSDLIVAFPCISDFIFLENLTIINPINSISIPSYFVSGYLSIYIFANIGSVAINAFADADIKEIIYCGNTTVDGDFLLKALSCDSVQCSLNYNKKTFGGKQFKQNSDICPVYHKNVNPTIKIIIIMCSSIGVILLLLSTILVYKCRQDQKAIQAKMLIEKLVVDDFG